MMRFAILGLLVSLAACSSVTAENERGGIISHVSGLDRDKSFQMADDNCHKYKRVARISGQDALEATMTYDCIAP